MFKLPLKKCYSLAKICVLFMLVVTILSLFELWRGGKRVARAHFTESLEEEYERQILEDEARVVPGLGDEGAPAYLSGNEQRLGDESLKRFAMNTYLSDRISYNRTLKDFRNPACARVVYDAELPSASVVIIFHNEPFSVVLRTVWSVLNGARRDQPWYKKANFVDREADRTMKIGYPGQEPDSEYVYLKEIILVDDNSTLPELHGKLSYYLRTRLPSGLVRLLRLPERVGLTRARLAGARFAAGDVLVFLDAHCEGQPDWLRPLLQRIKDNSKAVVVPIIDVVEAKTFYYSVLDTHSFQVGGFTFLGHFTWIDVPERERKRRGSEISPTWSPTMAGGLFAMSRSYYWELGAYDEQMAGWGGENLEISFRIWQCGGTLETIPCSRVGHVFRAFHPFGLPPDTDTHGINTARMAEVWMDEYAELFYLHRPDLRKNPKIGDVTHRKILREKLHCKSFQWFLDNVYKEKFVPVRDVHAYGRVQNPQTGLCLDTMQREAEGAPLGLYPCHTPLSATQYLSFSLTGQLRDEEKCAELQFERRLTEESEEDRPHRVLMSTCYPNQRGQQWNYLRESQQLRHVESGLCIDVTGAVAGNDVLARACSDEGVQKWTFDFDDSKESNGEHSKLLPPDVVEHLQKLKGLRRQSRSLAEPERRRRGHDRRRRRRQRAKRKNKKKNRKNKFILILERTLMNNSDEHLELDVHCAHRRLLPNNTFVRDLVTILNEKNIRVINNGRVFERNRVTELGSQDPNSLRQEEVKVLEKMSLPAGLVQPPPSPPPPPAVVQPSEPIISERVVRKWLQDEYGGAGAGAGAGLSRASASPATVFRAELPKRVKTHKKRNRHKTVPPRVLADSSALASPAPAAGGSGGTGGTRGSGGSGGTGGSGGEGGAVAAGGSGGTTPGAKRIIIEDFVEIRPSLPPPLKHSKKHKHEKKGTSRQRGPAQSLRSGMTSGEDEASSKLQNAGAGAAPVDAPGNALGDSGSDDSYWAPAPAPDDAPTPSPAPAQRPRAGLAARLGDSDADDAPWSANTGQMKNTNSSSQLLPTALSDREADRSFEAEREMEREEELAQYARAREPRPPARGEAWQDTENKKAKAPKRYRDLEVVDNKPSDEPGPVKLVMRSNLTFNLGDELFAWRRQPDIVNILKGQLSLATSQPRARDNSSDESSASDSSGST